MLPMLSAPLLSLTISSKTPPFSHIHMESQPSLLAIACSTGKPTVEPADSTAASQPATSEPAHRSIPTVEGRAIVRSRLGLTNWRLR